MDFDLDKRMVQIRLMLRHQRAQMGWSQQEAANMLGIYRETLSYIEAGKQKLTVELLLKMSNYYNTPLPYLLLCDEYGDGEP